MSEYMVYWLIPLAADSPEDAARQAREIQLDPESCATIFNVIDTTLPVDASRYCGLEADLLALSREIDVDELDATTD